MMKSLLNTPLARRFKSAIRAFLAAKQVGPNQQWQPMSSSADYELRRDNKRIRNRVRDLERNNAHITGAIRRFATNTVGEGAYCRPHILNPDGSLNQEISKTIEMQFMRWAETCVLDGTTFYELQNLITRHQFTDGEFLIYTPIVGGELKLQGFEVDQLDEVYDGQLTPTTYAIKGIELDQYGKPLRFYLQDKHPGDGLGIGVTRTIPATDIIHYYEKLRSSQHRGACMFASVVMEMFDTAEFTDATILLARLASAYGIFIETPNPDDYMAMYQKQTNAGGQTDAIAYVNPGGIHYLRPGEKPNSLKPEQPIAGYKDFISTRLKAASAGIGQSYENFSGDYSQSTYSSARMAMLAERAMYRYFTNLLENKVYTPIYRKWLDMDVLSGRLKLANYEQDKVRYQRVKWSRPRQEWIDPAKEAIALQREIELGINNRTKACEDRGEDFLENLATLALEKEAMTTAGLWLETQPAEGTSPMQVSTATGGSTE